MKTVRVTRYVTPLREGGSLPAVVEADDDGLYVLKFRGAGQGPLALVAELISGEIGRLLGLRVPELVFLELDACIGRNEPDPEIRDLLLSSVGLNLGLDYLPGATMFDPAAGDAADAATASKGVWFDAFITNIDRTAKNANLLWWHKQLYFIDHGASLYFHHNWGDVRAAAVRPVSAIKDHILLSWASRIEAVDRELRSRLDDLAVRQIAAGVPAPWLEGIDGPDPAGYVEYLTIRLRNSGSLMTRCAHMTNSFDYALIRVVPSVEREEFFNTGVILFCPQRRYLSARVYLNREKLKAFLPHWL